MLSRFLQKCLIYLCFGIMLQECSSIEDGRKCLPGSNNSSRRGSLCSSRISETTPVENIVYQSQIDTLQWQLKQVFSILIIINYTITCTYQFVKVIYIKFLMSFAYTVCFNFFFISSRFN